MAAVPELLYQSQGRRYNDNTEYRTIYIFSRGCNITYL